MVGASAMLPMAWDEGYAIERAQGVHEWFAELRQTGIDACADETLARHWHYTVEIEGHPSGYGCLISLGQWLASVISPWIAPLTAARVGSMLVYSLAAGAMFGRLRRQYSLVAGVGGMAGLILQPRLFAHAHFASYDGPLTACWVLAWAAFAPAMESIAWAALWGAALGLTMSMKVTGWLAPLPFIGYAVVYGDRRAVRTLATGCVVALTLFWLLNPRLWWHPVVGMLAFLNLNLGRAGTELDIPTMFAGSRFSMVQPLPWYNTLVWTAITVPVGLLALAALGAAAVLHRWTVDGHGVLLILNWVLLVAVRAFPGTPVHDAERLFLPSFAFLAALMGVGCQTTARFLIGATWLGGNGSSRASKVAPALRDGAKSKSEGQTGGCLSPFFQRLVMAGLVTAYLGAATSLLWYAPQWLSYYNLSIGGLRGADAAGFEATYYWDALDSEVLDWLNAHTADGETIEFASGSLHNLNCMRQWGMLRHCAPHGSQRRRRWYVIQRRPTFWLPHDRWLIERETPAFLKTIRSPTAGIGAWRLDVPLIEVFSGDQHRRAMNAVLSIHSQQ